MADARNEPPFPDHDTVMFCSLAPDLVLHERRADCSIEEPHHIDACGAFQGDAASA